MSNSNNVIIIPTCHWLSGRSKGFRYQNNGTTATVSSNVESISKSEYNLIGGVYTRTRHIRKGYLSNFANGIALPTEDVPTLIEWRFLLSVSDTYFTNERLKVYAVPINDNGANINNYTGQQYLLASVLLSSLSNNAYNIIELDIDTYLAKIVDDGWGLLVVCNSDDYSIDPGFNSSHPVTGLAITFESSSDEYLEYLRLTYTTSQENVIELAEKDNNTPASIIVTPFDELNRKFKLLVNDYVRTLGRVPPGLEDEIGD